MSCDSSNETERRTGRAAAPQERGFHPNSPEGKLLLGLYGMVFWGAVFSLFQLLLHLPAIIAYFSEPSHRIVGFVISVLVAFALFAFRLFARALYGVTELAFGVVVLWGSFATVSNTGANKWPIVVAAIYVLVRGFDNLHQGVGSPLKRKRGERKAEQIAPRNSRPAVQLTGS